MDYHEAIEVLKDFDSQVNAKADGAYQTRIEKMACDIGISVIQEFIEYKKIGNIDDVKYAVDKQHPRSPTYEGDGYAPNGTFVWDEWLCPNCGHRFEVEYEEYDYCPYCGQAIDWSEKDD
ncbi:MAG: hypothetical protein ACI4EO_01940 [Blautia sp.]